jgi:hypothetical protein
VHHKQDSIAEILQADCFAQPYLGRHVRERSDFPSNALRA